MTKGRGGARQDPDMGPSPWAGSLRHVDDKKKKAMMKKKKKEDGMYSLFRNKRFVLNKMF